MKVPLTPREIHPTYIIYDQQCCLGPQNIPNNAIQSNMRSSESFQKLVFPTLEWT
jgi:hypothetical protein